MCPLVFLRLLLDERNMDKISFNKFFLKELPLLSRNYAQERVILKPNNFEKINSRRGGVFLFLHFGNFYLSGAALVAKLKLNYTAIASTKNFVNMPENEVVFWKHIHNLANQTYSRDMFLSHEKNSKEKIDFLKDGNFLGAAINVAEVKLDIGLPHINALESVSYPYVPPKQPLQLLALELPT